MKVSNINGQAVIFLIEDTTVGKYIGLRGQRVEGVKDARFFGRRSDAVNSLKSAGNGSYALHAVKVGGCLAASCNRYERS